MSYEYDEEELEPCCPMCGSYCENAAECEENVRRNREYQQQRAELLAAQESATINRIMGIGGSDD